MNQTIWVVLFIVAYANTMILYIAKPEYSPIVAILNIAFSAILGFGGSTIQVASGGHIVQTGGLTWALPFGLFLMAVSIVPLVFMYFGLWYESEEGEEDGMMPNWTDTEEINDHV